VRQPALLVPQQNILDRPSERECRCDRIRGAVVDREHRAGECVQMSIAHRGG
jgi:hypothetical protein